MEKKEQILAIVKSVLGGGLIKSLYLPPDLTSETGLI